MKSVSSIRLRRVIALILSVGVSGACCRGHLGLFAGAMMVGLAQWALLSHSFSMDAASDLSSFMNSSLLFTAAYCLLCEEYAFVSVLGAGVALLVRTTASRPPNTASVSVWCARLTLSGLLALFLAGVTSNSLLVAKTAVLTSGGLFALLTWLEMAGVTKQLTVFEYGLLYQGLSAAVFQVIKLTCEHESWVQVLEVRSLELQALYMTSLGGITVVVAGELGMHVATAWPERALYTTFIAIVVRRWLVCLDYRPDLVLANFMLEEVDEDHGRQSDQEAYSQVPSMRGLGIVLFFAAFLLITVPLSHQVSTWAGLSNITSRKLFHLVAVLMFWPAINIRQDTTLLAFGVAFCGMLMVEYLRLVMPQAPYSVAINEYYASFVDQRDASRALTLTHIQLAVGCALPVWCASILITSESYEVMKSRSALSTLLPHLGWISVGVLDAVSAVVGKACGRFRWPGTSRTLEGTTAGFLAACTLAILALRWGIVDGNANSQLPPPPTGAEELWAGLVALLVAAVVEAFTFDVDNILLPLVTVLVFCVILEGQ